MTRLGIAFRATATSRAGGLQETPKIGVLSPFTPPTISENFTIEG